jgi:hypothetical protein
MIEGIHIQKQRLMEEIYKYAIEMGSCAMIYIQSFIKIGSSIQKLVGGYSQTCRQHGDYISLLLGK